MFLQKIPVYGLPKIILKTTRFYSQNPMKRTWNVLTQDIMPLLGSSNDKSMCPEHADVVVIGGGFIGSSVAYWLKTKAGAGLSVVVIEKDNSYKKMQQYNLGALTHHYSLPENILLSKFSAEFLRNIQDHINFDLDIQYCPINHLVLASEKYAHKLQENILTQKELGIKNELLNANELKNKYPWINTSDITFGSVGLESEGTYNMHNLFRGFLRKSKELGTIYVNAEVTGFVLEEQRDVLMEGVAPGTYQKIAKVIYKTPDNEEHSIKFACCVLATGEDTAEIAKLANIGVGEGLLSVAVPVSKRKSKIYSINDKEKRRRLCTPLIQDTTGLWLRGNGLGNNLLCGHIPMLDSQDDTSFDTHLRDVVRPTIVNRIPDFMNAELNEHRVEESDCNTYDDTGIIGPHPYYNNLIFAAGFGKLGCAFAPGIGRAVSELVINSQYNTIDLTRFGFDRILVGQPQIEFNVY